jgi:hypothetical protein
VAQILTAMKQVLKERPLEYISRGLLWDLIMIKLLNFLLSILFLAFVGFMIFLFGQTIYYLINLNWTFVCITLFKLFLICILFCLIFINFFVNAVEYQTGKKIRF